MQRHKPSCRCHYPTAAGTLPNGEVEYTCLYCGARLVTQAQLEARKARAQRIKDLLKKGEETG